MIEPELKDSRNPFLGEIETRIVGMQHCQAELLSGEQIGLERESRDIHDRRAIRVENGLSQLLGYLPRQVSSWLAPLIDQGKIHLEGYTIPCDSPAEGGGSCPAVLMVFQSEGGGALLRKVEPQSKLEALHQTILQAYENAQSYHTPELILGLAQGLQPLTKQELLPDTRLLLALLPRIAREARMCQGMRAAVKFRELLGSLSIGRPTQHHNLTFFPLRWPQSREPSYTLLNHAIRTGEAVVEEIDDSDNGSNLAVKNQGSRPLLIPKGEIPFEVRKKRVVNVTVLVAAGKTFVLPVHCLDAGGSRDQSRHLESSQRISLLENASGVLVGRHDRIIGVDLFDSPTTLETLWGRLSDAYFCDARLDSGAAPATTFDRVQRFIERLVGAARPRPAAMALGDELEISGEGLAGAALLYEGQLCHLAAFSHGE